MSTSLPGGEAGFGAMIVIIYVVICIVALVAAFLLAIIPSKIAKNKGYSGVGFYWFGVAALVPAIIVACVLRNRNADPPAPTPVE